MKLDIIYVYLLIINVLTFILFGIDKLKAIINKHRIKEITLFTFCLCGGSIGGLLAMYIFNHKTRKKSFTIVIPLMLIIEFILSIYLIRM